MNPKIDPKASLNELKSLKARIDGKLRELIKMRTLKGMKAETKRRLAEGIKELERTRKEVAHSIERLAKVLKKKL